MHMLPRPWRDSRSESIQQAKGVNARISLFTPLPCRAPLWDSACAVHNPESNLFSGKNLVEVLSTSVCVKLNVLSLHEGFVF